MTTKKTNSKKNQVQPSVKDVYEKVVEDISKYQKDYLDSKFKGCYPQAQEISKTWADTVWSDSMKIMQDFPSDYTKNAAICFFAFAGEMIDTYLAIRYQNGLDKKDLPIVLPVQAKSDLIKSLIERAEKELSAEGQELVKNLLLRDFGYFFAVLKALQIESTVINNLLIGEFRMFVFEIMLPHLFASEKKQGEENENN